MGFSFFPFFMWALKEMGQRTFLMTQGIGRVILFLGNSLGRGIKPPYYGTCLWIQILEFGYYSLAVVGLTALFTGMVLALQSHTGLGRFHGESAMANVVILSMARELGPVLAGLMVAGRVGASMAAELGTMRVTEQIDALYTLSTDPLRYLVFPRILAGTLLMPFLVLVAIVIGVMGGYTVAVYDLGFAPGIYISQSLEALETRDLALGLTKAAVFGFLLSGLSCYCGYNARRGAQGVGQASIQAVVTSSIAILLANYILTSLLFRS